LMKIGMENIWANTALNSKAFKAAVKAWGLELFSRENSSTGLSPRSVSPQGVDGQDVVKWLKDKYSIFIAGGQAQAKGKIFRVAHMGYINKFDTLQAIGAIEMALRDWGTPLKWGRRSCRPEGVWGGLGMKILVSDPLHEDGIKIFKDQGFEVEVNYGLSPDDLNQAIKGVHGLVIRSATKVTPELLDAADALKVVGRAGTGLDNVDIPAATKKGVIVMNTPGQNSNAAAELAVGHMFALARHIARGHAGIKQGKWEKKQLKGRELKGKTVGIVGMGAIGSIVAEMLQRHQDDPHRV
jgi:hypothetical protein